MDDVSAVTDMIKRLPDDHRQRLINLIWLLSQVDEPERRAAIKRVETLLDGGPHNEAVFIRGIEAAIERLQEALDGKTGIGGR